MASPEVATLRSCCVSGHIHKGTPKGRISTIHGHRTYSTSPIDRKEGKADTIILLSDVFGIDLINTQLVADEFASKGFEVLLPDFFENGPIDTKYMNSITPNLKTKREFTDDSRAQAEAEKAQSLTSFLPQNPESVARPKIENFVKALREDPKTGKLAVIGYCWGGRYALLLAKDDFAYSPNCVIGYHPSLVTNDDVRGITKTPVAILQGTEDDIMPDSELVEKEDILRPALGEKLLVKRYKDAVHGFTLRGDLEDGEQKRQKEEALEDGVQFIRKALDSES